MHDSDPILPLLHSRLRRERLLETAVRLMEVHSPTRDAGAALTVLANILTEAGLEVSREEADWPSAPAVVAWLHSGKPGPVLQFDCHLDTVHLPFVPPRIENGMLFGTGASDMKGGTAAAVEALRMLRELDLPARGSVLLTGHDHHEGPWGDKRQVVALCRAGIHGDAVLLPEYQAAWLPTDGRGMAIFCVEISRAQPPSHEILTDPETPDVIGAGLDLVGQLRSLSLPDSPGESPAGRESLFIGKVQTGEIYNQSPQTCIVEGTRRWLQPGAGADARRQIEEVLTGLDARHGTTTSLEWELQGDTFHLPTDHPIVQMVQEVHTELVGRPLPDGPKLFIDDGNIYTAEVGIPAVTHGPDALGAHTVNEEVPVTELERIALLYAATAVGFCQELGDAAVSG